MKSRYDAYKELFRPFMYWMAIFLNLLSSGLMYAEKVPIFFLVLNLIGLCVVVTIGLHHFFKKTVKFFILKAHLLMGSFFAPFAFGFLSFIGDGPVTMNSGLIHIPENVWVAPVWQTWWIVALGILILLVICHAFQVKNEWLIPVLKQLAQYKHRGWISEAEFSAIFSAPQIKKKMIGNIIGVLFLVLVPLQFLNGDATLWKLFGGSLFLIAVILGYTLAAMHVWYSRIYMPGFDLKIEEA
jgi:hypothetical protein